MRTMDLVASTLLSLCLYKTYFAHAGYTFQGSPKRGSSQPFDVNRELSDVGECGDECDKITYCVSITWTTTYGHCYMHHDTEMIPINDCNCDYYTRDGSVEVASISTTTTENGIEYNIFLETSGIEGLISEKSISSSHLCREECDKTPGCVAVRYSIYSYNCSLYNSRTADGNSNYLYVFYVIVEQEETTVATEATTTVTEMATSTQQETTALTTTEKETTVATETTTTVTEMTTTTLQDTTALTTDMTTTEEETTFVTEAKTTVTEMITTTLQEPTAMTTDMTTAEEERTKVTTQATSSIYETDKVSQVPLDETETSSAIASLSFGTATSPYNTADYSTTDKPQSFDPEVTSFWMSSSKSISVPAPTDPSSHQIIAYTNSSVPKAECLCNCKDTPNRTLEEAIAAITARLTVRKESLSSSTRKLISATDNRYSSKQLGFLGIAMISFVFVFLTFSDFCSTFYFMSRSIRQCVNKTN